MNQLMNISAGEDPGVRSDQMKLGGAFTKVTKNPLQAINADTGKLAWTYHAAQSLIGGAFATARNLVLMGKRDGYFEDFDATSSKKLCGNSTWVPNSMRPFRMGFRYGDTIVILRLPR